MSILICSCLNTVHIKCFFVTIVSCSFILFYFVFYFYFLSCLIFFYFYLFFGPKAHVIHGIGLILCPKMGPKSKPNQGLEQASTKSTDRPNNKQHQANFNHARAQSTTQVGCPSCKHVPHAQPTALLFAKCKLPRPGQAVRPLLNRPSS